MTDISAEKFNFICRLCTSSLVNGGCEIFPHNDVAPKQIPKKIAVCLPVKVEIDDKLPKSVCTNCALKLDEFYSYRESCLRNERILLKCLSNSSSDTFDEKIDDPNDIEESKNSDICDEHDISPHKNEVNSVENPFLDDGSMIYIEPKKELLENNLSDAEMSPSENIGMSEDDDDDDLDDDKSKELLSMSTSLPELAEPSPEDYVLMKEETFNLDPVKEFGNKGATSSILADYLIEFSNSKSVENDLKDKDILESQRLRREVLPPMWDVYEKSVSEKENLPFDGTGERERIVTVTHRRYIINKGAFPCSLCGECFEFDQGKRRDDFAEEKSKLYDCLTCGKVFPRRSSWKRHQSTHEDIKPFVCRLCNKGFNRKEHLTRHLLSHGSIRPYNCSNCGKQFVRKEHLTRHQICNVACAVPADNVLRPFSCDVCAQGFVRKEHLFRHRKRAHDLDPPEGESEPKPFTCNVCTKTFTRREHLKRHQLIHQRDFTASALSSLAAGGARLYTNADDQYHSEVSIFPATPLLPEITLSEVISSVARDESDSATRTYNGSPCREKTSDGVENATEDSVNHYANSGANEDDIEMEDGDEPLPPIPVLEMTANAATVTPAVTDITKSNTFCNVCFKNFSRRSHLLRHMKRIHSMQLPPSRRRSQPQQQVQPLQQLPQVQLLQTPKPGGDENGNSLTDSAVGQQAATIEQTFKCQLCGKVFSRRSHLERHEKNVHQLNKEANQPYECVTCGETFIQSKLLDRHMQLHGNTVPENYVWM